MMEVTALVPAPALHKKGIKNCNALNFLIFLQFLSKTSKFLGLVFKRL